jgi:hypothetical protein
MRERNDDAFCAEKIGPYHLFAIAEGLPTPPYGDLACRTAIDALRAVVRETKGSAQEILIAGIRQAEADVRVARPAPETYRPRNHPGGVPGRYKDELHGPRDQ